jgi:uncharacterized cysteine cluster protein YcgN (CxxCxxCC family)
MSNIDIINSAKQLAVVCDGELLPFCECGECGLRVTKPGNRFIHGHNMRGVTLPPRTPEHCDAISRGRQESDAVKAHNERMRGVSLSPETCAKMSVAKMGVPIPPFTPEHCAAISRSKMGHPVSDETRSAISETIRNSDTTKAQHDTMCGGKDIIYHHYICDHNDLSKYTTKMTRSRHSRLHRLMKISGIEVPHINKGA